MTGDLMSAQKAAVVAVIDAARDRACRAHKRVHEDGVDRNAELALADAAAELAKTRDRLAGA